MHMILVYNLLALCVLYLYIAYMHYHVYHINIHLLVCANMTVLTDNTYCSISRLLSNGTYYRTHKLTEKMRKYTVRVRQMNLAAHSSPYASGTLCITIQS